MHIFHLQFKRKPTGYYLQGKEHGQTFIGEPTQSCYIKGAQSLLPRLLTIEG